MSLVQDTKWRAFLGFLLVTSASRSLTFVRDDSWESSRGQLGEFERTAWEDWRGQLGRIGEDSLGGLEGTAWEDWRGQLRRIGENSLGGLERTA
jgi:hypothetical protein